MTESNLNVFLNSSLLISVIIGGCVLLLMYIIRMLKNNNQSDVDVTLKNVSKTVGSDRDKETSNIASSKAVKKKPTESRWTGGRSDKHNYTHPWLLASLKGHTGQVLDMDFSSNGKYLATCAEDRTVLLWCVKDLEHKERRSLRINIEFDHARLVKWSPDSKAFIISRSTDNNVEVYRVERKRDGWLGPVARAITFPKVHDEDIVGLAIACHGRFIMTCSAKTDLVLWDLRGAELARVDTYLMTTQCARISPCGRFIVASGFAPDVKVWEVSFNKAGDFQHVKRAFELTGHTSGVYDVAFDADTSHMATVSKDGTWKVYDTKIEYGKGEDPHLVVTGTYQQPAGLQQRAHIALAPNAEVVAVAAGDTLALYSVRTGQLDQSISDVYPMEAGGGITGVMFDALGRYVLTCGDKHVRVFHNVTGYRCGVLTARERLRENPTSATKERLEKYIVDSEIFLAQIATNAKQQAKH